MKSVFLTVAVILATLTLVQGQIGNYLLTAYDSALGMKHVHELSVENYRNSLAIESQDFGNYFTARLADVLETATTEAQGTALSNCAANAATSSRNSINRFDATLIPLQDAAMRLHLSIWEELIATNLKADLDLFYYQHNLRLEERYDHLNNVLVDRIRSYLTDLELSYFEISTDLNICIASAMVK